MKLAAALLLLTAVAAKADPLAPPPQPGTPAPAPLTMARPDSAKALEDNVRAAVADSESRVGKLEPWQKKIFDEEVVPQYRKFVRDFSGSSAIVDVNSIRNYLRFYGPAAFHGSNHKILVYYRTAQGCDACAVGRDKIQADLKNRLERRGLEPVWLTPEEAEGQGITGGPRQIAERVLSAAHAQGANAELTLLIDPVPVDDLDSAHADEKHYMIRTTLDLRDIAHEEGQVDVIDPSPFDAPVAMLMNDAFTDTGVKLAQLPTDASGAASAEVRIEVRGTGDFTTYAHARDALAEKLKGDGALEEREISRGRAVFALVTSRSPASVRKDLGSNVLLDSGAGAIVPEVPGADPTATATAAPNDSTILMEVHQ